MVPPFCPSELSPFQGRRALDGQVSISQDQIGGNSGNWGWGRAGEVLAEIPPVLPRPSATQALGGGGGGALAAGQETYGGLLFSSSMPLSPLWAQLPL